MGSVRLTVRKNGRGLGGERTRERGEGPRVEAEREGEQEKGRREQERDGWEERGQGRRGQELQGEGGRGRRMESVRERRSKRRGGV